MKQTLELEIGAGVGWHAIRRARAEPHATLIALEHGEERFSKFVSRLKTHESMPNLYAIQAEACSWARKNLGPQSIDRVYILYPNPNPKKKLTRLRWFRMPFMQNLIQMLKENGQIVLATNIREYAEEARVWGQNHWGLRLIQDHQLQKADLPKGYPRTHFEKKYLERGEVCFDLIFQKTTKDVNRQ